MKRWIAVIIAALMVFSMACAGLSLGGNDNNEGAEVTAVISPEGEEPVDEPSSSEDVPDPDDEEAMDDGEDVDEEEPRSDGELPDVDMDALEQLDSYRATLSWTLEKADGTTESFEIAQAATRDPAANQFSMASNGEAMEFVQIGDQMYMRFGEEWMQTSSDEADADEFGDFLTTGEEWVNDLEDEDYEDLGEDEVNGITAHGYSYEYDEGWMNLLDTEMEVDDWDAGTAEVWIAAEPDLPQFVVRFVAEMSGAMDTEDVTATLAMDIYDINEPFTIEVPEGVAQSGLPEDVPVYPNATDVTILGGMAIFTTPDDVTTVNDFYTEALTSAGWGETDEGFSSSEMVNAIWEKDGDRLMLAISPSEEGSDETSVMINLEAAE